MTAFADLVEEFQSPVYNLCYRMLGEAAAAENATQETFLRAFQHLDSYDPSRPFKTWLLSIASHHCIDRLRRQHVTWLCVDDDLLLNQPALREPSPGPEIAAIRREEGAQIQQLLDSLPPQDRCAIILRHWYDLSYVEMATILGTTVSGVKSRLHRARLTLGNRLAPMVEGEPMQLADHAGSRGASCAF